MGCVASKKSVLVIPATDSGHLSWDLQESGEFLAPPAPWSQSHCRSRCRSRSKSDESQNTVSSSARYANKLRVGNYVGRGVEGEQAAAGWPSWLCNVAGEAIQGWVPLSADSYQKLEKIGQGTYSNVFKARAIETGKLVALKKVRFDNFEPESIKFMAREIQILRRLDHPNIVKLEGLITSRNSCSLYLVFEYMEHDLAGLSSSPDITFSQPQIKCYMQQLLSGLEHCHSQGVMHRDVKCANVLVNNEGIVKIADFGLANFVNPEPKQPLTSRVVTLWYRPPELLLGSTDYHPTVDLWSVGCIFAEILLGKPILQGRTEVEQLHKIFKLCGSPTEEFWKKSKLPHATTFKPQRPYESSLRNTLKCLPESAVSLLETLLCVEPYKRGTATEALEARYFRTKPYACEPSSLPGYPPNKEINAKVRESQKRSTASREKRTEAMRRSFGTTRALNSGPNNLEPHREDWKTMHSGQTRREKTLNLHRVNGDGRQTVEFQSRQPLNQSPENQHVIYHQELPLHVSVSSGFVWAKKPIDHEYLRSSSRYSSTSNESVVIDSLRSHGAEDSRALKGKENGKYVLDGYKGHGSYRATKQATQKQRIRADQDILRFSAMSSDSCYKKDAVSSTRSLLGYKDQEANVKRSVPLVAHPCSAEPLGRHKHHFRQVVRKSLFLKGIREKRKPV